LRDFVERACRQAGGNERICYDLKLAVDEACSNIVDHGYAGREPGTIGVAFKAEAERFVVTITDHGRAFAPSSAPTPDLTSDWRERRTGELGWHLIRQMVDEINYESDSGGGNRLTLAKRVPRVPPG